jgi:denticleless
MDPTTLHGSRRPRGITSLTPGTGPTTGLLFALGADSRIHTYDLPTLEPLTSNQYTHENMQTNSFYVRLAASPCGRWLASGCGGNNGSVFLYDVSHASRTAMVRFGGSRAVELRGQCGEVGAVDWAEGVLASCADDGTVRAWRPDVGIYKECERDTEEGRWGWSWAVGENL